MLHKPYFNGADGMLLVFDGDCLKRVFARGEGEVWRGAKQKGPQNAVFCVLGTQLWIPVESSCFSVLWYGAKAKMLTCFF